MKPTNGYRPESAIANNRLPKITWEFWVLIFLAVAGGETAADFLADGIGLSLPYATLLMAGGLLIFLFLQFSKKYYVPWIYWLTIILVNIVGTLVTDNFVDVLGYSVGMCVTVYSVILFAILSIWFAIENNISVQNVLTDRREILYWLATLFTFSLGTAACDLLSDDLGYGFLPSALTYGLVIIVTAIAFFAKKISSVMAFWIAYIFIRPSGAAFGNFLSHPFDRGGLAWGASMTSLVFFIGIVAFFIHVNRKWYSVKSTY